MKVALWAEIRRLAEIDKLSGRAIARRLHCSGHTVAAALDWQQPPASHRRDAPACSIPTWSRSTSCWPSIPTSRRCASARRSPADHRATPAVSASYAATCASPPGTRPRLPRGALPTGPGDAGRLGRVRPHPGGSTMRKVSVFVAVICYSRLLFIEFTLSQRKAEFYRGLVNALTFFGGSPQPDLRQPQGGRAQWLGPIACFHPEFLALCGYFCLQPVACARRDSESKGYASSCTYFVTSETTLEKRRGSDRLIP